MRYIYVVLGLLVADGIISLAFLSTMVAFLHTSGGGPYDVTNTDGSTFQLRGEPAQLITNHGHTTNGAGGTIVVALGFGGLIALTLEHRARKLGKSSPLFLVWAVLTVLSWLLTMAALIYTFVVTSMTASQTIDLTLAAANPYPGWYPVDSWTPENWYKQMLNLPLVEEADRVTIRHNLRIMTGWRYNLIPLFILGLALAVLAVLEVVRIRKARGERVPTEHKGKV